MARAFGLATLLLAVVALTSSPRTAQAADKETEAAQKDILDLVKDIEGGKDVKTKVAGIKKKYDELNTLMHAYKPSTKGGIGTGIPPKGAGDGIEMKIINLGKRALPAATLSKEKDALIKLANVNIALAEITRAYAPTKVKGGKGAKEWNLHVDDMKKAAQELAAAAKGGDPAKVKTAASNLNTSCNNCHTDFRDSN